MLKISSNLIPYINHQHYFLNPALKCSVVCQWGERETPKADDPHRKPFWLHMASTEQAKDLVSELLLGPMNNTGRISLAFC